MGSNPGCSADSGGSGGDSDSDDEGGTACFDDSDASSVHSACCDWSTSSENEEPTDGLPDVKAAENRRKRARRATADNERQKKVKLYAFNEKPRILGGYRQPYEIRKGTMHGDICYGDGRVEDGMVYPCDDTLQPFHALPLDYGWRSAPERKVTNPQYQERKGENLLLDAAAPPLQWFMSLFVDGGPMKVWMDGTNARGEELQEQWRREGSKRRWEPLTRSHALAFLAIFIWSDVMKVGTFADLWRTDKRRWNDFVMEVASTTGMTRQRFQTILKCTRLYDKEVAERSGWLDRDAADYDTQAKIRPFVDAINLSFDRHRKCGSACSIDEAMSKYKGRWSNLRSMKDKPIKRGIMFFNLNEPNGWCSRMLLHTNQTLPYSNEMGYYSAVVFNLLSGAITPGLTNYLDDGKIIYTDRLYTAVPLFYALAKRNTFGVGTLDKKKKKVPKDAISLFSKMSRGGSVSMHDTEDVLSFTAWKDLGDVCVLSSHPTIRNDKGGCIRRLKGTERGVKVSMPAIVANFSAYMAGVDLGDQFMAANYRHRKTYLWSASLFLRKVRLCTCNIFAVKREAGGNLEMKELKAVIAEGLLSEAKKCAPQRPPSSRYKPPWLKGLRITVPDQHTPQLLPRRYRRVCVMCGKGNCRLKCMQCGDHMHGEDCWVRAHAAPAANTL